MYTPKHFQLENESAMLDAVEKWNFGLVISGSSTAKPTGIETSLLPFMVDRENNRLLGHFARANPHWKTVIEPSAILVSFQGPHCYISPNWYDGENLVPTWNYLSVQITGRAKLIEDDDQCTALIESLVGLHESGFNSPWTVDKVDSTKLNAMMKAIVCFEVSIDEINGKAKLSQNRSIADQRGVINTLSRSGNTDETEIQQMMEKNLADNG